MLGRVIMLEDHKRGGVTSKTYLNITLSTCLHLYRVGQNGKLLILNQYVNVNKTEKIIVTVG